MQEKVLKITAVFTIIFAVLAAVLMGWFQMNRETLVRTDTLTDEVAEETENKSEVVSTDTASDFMQMFVEQIEENGKMTIRFQQEIALQNSILRYDYVNRYMYLWMPEVTERELVNCKITADDLIVKTTQITASNVTREQVQGVEIKLPLLGYYTGSSSIDTDSITLEFEEIKPSSELTVVLDAGHGGMDVGSRYGSVNEKDIALKITQKLSEKLEKQEIRVFCTRYDDSDASEQVRVAFANAIKADMLISVHLELLEQETEQTKIGLTAVYNSKYFIPEFGSVDLANTLEQETIQKMGGVANGLVAADSDNVLVSQAQVPVAELEIDSTIQENELKSLESDAYIEKITDGIYQGIMQAQENLQQP